MRAKNGGRQDQVTVSGSCYTRKREKQRARNTWPHEVLMQGVLHAIRRLGRPCGARENGRARALRVVTKPAQRARATSHYAAPAEHPVSRARPLERRLRHPRTD
eukprot:3754863-Pyramimonas_sp.AAC.1